MSPGDKVFVPFALGGSVVTLVQPYRMHDGETVWIVEDEERGHGDQVGESWMRATAGE